MVLSIVKTTFGTNKTHEIKRATSSIALVLALGGCWGDDKNATSKVSVTATDAAVVADVKSRISTSFRSIDRREPGAGQQRRRPARTVGGQRKISFTFTAAHTPARASKGCVSNATSLQAVTTQPTNRPSLTRWVFFRLELVATRYKTLYRWLHKTGMKKPTIFSVAGFPYFFMGWLMGLEPTTTGITILTFYYSSVLINTLQSI